jgi:type II secretory pathway pseudopilin PulG
LRSVSLVRMMLHRIVGRTYSFVEFMIVTLIIALLAAGASPVYEGYVRSARMVEGQFIATSLWTALRTQATGACGTAISLVTAYGRAGLDVTGATGTARWLVTHGHFNAITMDCASGVIKPDGDVFTISGGADEIKAVRVRLVHVASATPTLRLYCSNDSGVSFTDC